MPGVAWFFAPPASRVEWAAMLGATAASALFLIIGTVYWRALARRLVRGDRHSLDLALALADRAERPGLALVALATVATGAAFALEGASRSAIAAALLTVLAALEYANYYHRQLQHFDNRADLKRLLTGAGLKRAHMARDLAAFRQRRARSPGEHRAGARR
ncbi:hypothetical protein [Sphingomonas mesophila]|uniref:hypothetical protein n=1 Tax=Sphingomonas mesophila TaxID=2303576 RepID=UPI0013C2B2F9|nr:hypothetical protein [Sphingomonas mesophila]